MAGARRESLPAVDPTAGSSASPEVGESLVAARERLRADEKLRRRADYQRCYRSGRRRGGQFLTLHVTPNQGACARLGLTASRRVGGAVVRNRLKRWTREIFRRWEGRRALPRVDLLVHLKPTVRDAEFEPYRRELLRQLESVRRESGPRSRSERSYSQGPNQRPGSRRG